MSDCIASKSCFSVGESGTNNISSRRRNLGRKARHRRKKSSEIVAAVACSSSMKPRILPSDRNYTWPAVKKLRDLSEGDMNALVRQLGYLPGNALSIAARVGNSFPGIDAEDPMVLKLYPLVLRDESDGTKAKRRRKGKGPINEDLDFSETLVEPFPTIYWVTHPCIRALISKLELDQSGVKLENRLKKDEVSLQLMLKAHKQYSTERYNLITEPDHEWIKKRKWEAAFSDSRGVAGIRNFGSIKCLHAHAAHYWGGCDSNVVGKWVAEELSRLLTKDGNHGSR